MKGHLRAGYAGETVLTERCSNRRCSTAHSGVLDGSRVASISRSVHMKERRGPAGARPCALAVGIAG
jgi:hypothetical protein